MRSVHLKISNVFSLSGNKIYLYHNSTTWFIERNESQRKMFLNYNKLYNMMITWKQTLKKYAHSYLIWSQSLTITYSLETSTGSGKIIFHVLNRHCTRITKERGSFPLRPSYSCSSQFKRSWPADPKEMASRKDHCWVPKFLFFLLHTCLAYHTQEWQYMQAIRLFTPLWAMTLWLPQIAKIGRYDCWVVL